MVRSTRDTKSGDETSQQSTSPRPKTGEGGEEGDDTSEEAAVGGWEGEGGDPMERSGQKIPR